METLSLASLLVPIAKSQAIVNVLRRNTRIKVDQDHVETVIPSIGEQVLIVNGAYRSEVARIEAIDWVSSSCDLTITSR
ncbi:unnamed protein product [Protopolystoma xenopodis]|uniref:Kin17 KOW domain-containing protein n=1 Tax=Protopolystoma xenopodis TaxID=117903 RepID=A0A448WT59_9PLAT|nr:unnamed protein product [Protopolystoma xenopodis]